MKKNSKKNSNKSKKSIKKSNKKKTFFFNPDNPKLSYDVYIDKNPKDTISIKYTTVEDVKKTSKHYNDIYKLYKTRTIMDLIYKSDKNLKLIFDFLILKNKDLVIGDLENIDLFATLDKYPVKDIISLLQQCK